ncbi:nicotinate-nucleotide--dimethylbenzimidazole phosphoribosyltransferase [Streptomyces rectiverticillatus]|uniref:nicotinate-nucleotide--dimethylbenzimidazole phosphoribosyltransferase n=1 Tax=Streptomyces rectiverticillatus TaxID=173860 RepID=UPI0015C2D31F|nr:nicotinate-nucleotide--dimethylbenzimidazole phosphoribosyltransferase [Streptomyces rectiverticillatus]QLE71255.1 nicotinate-nucleotide--dimethylbenzimidazole phosphoribosyltransferase [Streptomyces rectiverticillatus]
MTDTGQFPGEGQPENAGALPGHPFPADAVAPADPGAPAPQTPPAPPATYAFLDHGDGTEPDGADEDDLLLMPGAQGAWMEQPAVQGGTHESGGRDTGSVDYGDVRIPPAAAAGQPPTAPAAPRRPLHMGPPVPDPTGGVVRSLADRGPAAPAPAPVRPPAPPAVPAPGPEYLDGTVDETGTQQTPRLGEVPQQQPGTWDAQPQPPAAAFVPPQASGPAAPAVDVPSAAPEQPAEHPVAAEPAAGAAPSTGLLAIDAVVAAATGQVHVPPGVTAEPAPQAAVVTDAATASAPAAGAEPVAAPADAPQAEAAPAGETGPALASAPDPHPVAEAAPADQAAVTPQPAAAAEPVAAEVPAAGAGQPGQGAEAVATAGTPAGAAEPEQTAVQTDQGLIPAEVPPTPAAEAADQAATGLADAPSAEAAAAVAPADEPLMRTAPADAAADATRPEPEAVGAADPAVDAQGAVPAEAVQPADSVPVTDASATAPQAEQAAEAAAPAVADAAVDAQDAVPATVEGAAEAPVTAVQPEQAAGPVPATDAAAAASAPAAAESVPDGLVADAAVPAVAETVVDVQAGIPQSEQSAVSPPQADQAADAAAEPVADAGADAQAVPQAGPAAELAAEAAQASPVEVGTESGPASGAQPEQAAVPGAPVAEPAAPVGEPSAPVDVPAAAPQPEQAAVPAAPGGEPSAPLDAVAAAPQPAQAAAAAEAEAGIESGPAPVAQPADAPQSEQAAVPAAPGGEPSTPLDAVAAAPQPAQAATAAEAEAGIESGPASGAQQLDAPQSEEAAVPGAPAAEPVASAGEPSAQAAPLDAPATAPQPAQDATAAGSQAGAGIESGPASGAQQLDAPQSEEAAVPGAPAAEPAEPAEPAVPTGEPSAPSDPHAPAGVPQTEQATISEPQAPATEDAAQIPAPEQSAADLPEPAAEDDAQAAAPAGPQVLTPATAPEAPADVPADVRIPAPQQAPAEPAEAPEPVVPAPRAAEPAAEPAAEAEAPAEPEPEVPAAVGYGDAEREAVHRVMRERRDIRNGFRTDPIPHEVLLRVLEAAHTAPSVGHSQPWDFVVIRSAETRQAMHELAQRQRDAYAKSLPKGRAKQFKELKIEAILETPVNIVVTADPTRGGRHTLGRHTQPQMAPYSSALAVENLWLAARAEGLGVGWVSFFDEREMVRTLGLPEHLEVVAYLCVGYVDEFPDEPELMQAGWSKRRPLSWVVHEEEYGRRALPGEEPHDLLAETLRGIRPLDAKALGEAWERQKRMTKPSGALGMLEIISAQLCGLSRKCPPPIPEPAAVAIFAGDHGVHAQGVTAWPQEVTSQMVANFLGGGAVCNAFANQVGAEVCVVDVGVAGELPSTPGLLPRKIRPGTADITTGPAMTREEAMHALEVGIETARDLVAAGNKALLTGEMGIANTTVSAALVSVYTEADPAEITGRGTGINDEMHARKVDVVRRALELHRPDPKDPIGVLAAIGGLEHAALVGLILGAASLRTPVILDGVSAGAAALVARAIAPEALAACIAGHRSAEPGHVAALTKLGLRPLVDLDLRLGEGTGALLALPIVQSAARAMHEVATFDAAGVTEKA